jgi:transcriptional regulator with XRE-family HTH domain
VSGNAKRIEALRERTGKAADEIASAVGLSDAEYRDLEMFDDELITAPTLEQIKKLADAFGVPAPALFADQPVAVPHRVSYAELLYRVNAHLAAGMSREAFEEEIGWELAAFFEGEARTHSFYGVEFLKALCRHLNVWWMAALP